VLILAYQIYPFVQAPSAGARGGGDLFYVLLWLL